MGVYSGRGATVDINAISADMRKSVRLWEGAFIVILDPGPQGVYLRDKNNAAFKWAGMARVQPYRREVATATTTNPTTNQSVRFQVDFSEDGVLPDIKTNWQVAVLSPPDGTLIPDPYISNYQHVVRSALNSSLAWIRTIECQVNTELRVDYDLSIQPDGSGGWQWATQYPVSGAAPIVSTTTGSATVI